MYSEPIVKYRNHDTLKCFVMTKRQIEHDYKISAELLDKIKRSLLLPKPKKKAGRFKKDDRKIISSILQYSVVDFSNKLQDNNLNPVSCAECICIK